MTGVILALAEHPDSVPRTLSAARTLAGLMGGARINVLAVRLPPEATIMPTEEILSRHRATEIRDREQARVARLHAAFEAWVPSARTPGVAIDWADIEGLADSLVGEWGRRSDYIVLNRPGSHDGAAERLELHAALFDTDRPVLVVPPGRSSAAAAVSFGECVAIAWRDDRRTIRSVLAAMRLLARAREVHVLAGVREGAPAPALPDILAEHGIAARLHVLPVGNGVFGETVLAQAHALGADLLAMGAYTHNPWRELLLGGVTRHMLAHADLPLLMRH
jgi:nucleotide-binding universal stress UspA family protein